MCNFPPVHGYICRRRKRIELYFWYLEFHININVVLEDTIIIKIEIFDLKLILFYSSEFGKRLIISVTYK